MTNDDGVHAPGIRALARAAYERGMDVVVAAPEAEASGMSAALSAVTDDGRLVFRETELDGLPGVPAYAVAASPAYIAVLAGLGVRAGAGPAAVRHQRGANAGHAVLHSGTVGAALTAGNNGIRALAVSLDVLTAAAASAGSGGAAIAVLDSVDDESRHWSSAAELAATLLPWLAGADPGTVLNLNVPDRPADQVAGCARRHWPRSVRCRCPWPSVVRGSCVRRWRRTRSARSPARTSPGWPTGTRRSPRSGRSGTCPTWSCRSTAEDGSARHRRTGGGAEIVTRLPRAGGRPRRRRRPPGPVAVPVGPGQVHVGAGPGGVGGRVVGADDLTAVGLSVVGDQPPGGGQPDRCVPGVGHLVLLTGAPAQAVPRYGTRHTRAGQRPRSRKSRVTAANSGDWSMS
ncbi:5'/3'-nucleotidase SurE [Micromonospora sp. BRA006-A]|nr:5'/3'-nucleotidase SurE [Micromonospora sp. BRA006-A]